MATSALYLSLAVTADAAAKRPAIAPSEAPAAGFLARAQQHIRQREYWASPNERGLQAPNRRHDLRTYFSPTGIRVHERSTAGGSELLGISLARIGRGAALAEVPEGVVSSDGARVEIRRPGLVEWYQNSSEGLEQGFTLERKAPGAGPLVLELRLQSAAIALVGNDAVFTTSRGRKLHYGGLRVLDATRRRVPARMIIASENRLALHVEDAEALYPLAIDPLLSATADTQFVFGQPSAQFGYSVASAGDVNADGYADVIIGAPFTDSGALDQGAAFVFLGSAEGIPDANVTAATKLDGEQAGARFGTSVSAAGDVNGDGHADVIVGAEQYDAGEFNEGAAFVFHGTAQGIAAGGTSTAAAQLESNDDGAQLGSGVDGAGDVDGDGYSDVIVGAGFYSDGQQEEGAAFVFHGSASGIADGSPATAAGSIQSNQADAILGWKVAGAGDVNGDGYADVIVGALRFDSPQVDEGLAFLCLGGVGGIGNRNPSSAAAQFESDQIGAGMGYSVAGAGDVNGDGYADAIVGANGFDAGELSEGAAFVFLGSATGMADANPATAHAQLESNQVESLLGTTVAAAGDVNGDGYGDVIASAPSFDADLVNEGAAFVFFGSATGIADGSPASADVQLETNQTALGGVSFPWPLAVASAGDVNGDGYADVLLGAAIFDATAVDEGTVFLYHGGAEGIVDGNPATAVTQLESDQSSAVIGWSVAGAGDVNADGYADVIVGARNYDAGQNDEGAAFVFHGSASGVADANATTAVAQLESNQVSANFGWSVAGAGDVDADGFSDVIVGARNYDAGQNDEGAAFVFHGSAAGIADGSPATAATQLESDDDFSQFGVSVAGAGDVNGDGRADVVVGAASYNQPPSSGGGAFVFHGGAAGVADGTPSTASARLLASETGRIFGHSVESAGDVNGDGYADVIVGAFGSSDGENNEGAAFLFHGSAGGVAHATTQSAATRLESNQAQAGLGLSVAGAGDVNGDNYADVIVGAFGYDAGEFLEGAAFVFHGSASGIPNGNPALAASQLESDQAGARFGHHVSGVGDVNGDGYADVIVSAPLYDAGETNEGAAFVFLGGAAGVADGNPASATAQLESDQAGAAFNGQIADFPVAGAGDVNADGFADVIVGAPFYDAGHTDEGAAWVFLGNGNRDGQLLQLQQQRGDGSGVPVQAWGTSQEDDQFEVELFATHPQGRGLVKLQVDACPPGEAFGSLACSMHTSASWTEVPPGGAAVILSQLVSGLPPEIRYRWRARVLHAPLTATQPGISAPPNPAHGPWRRPQAQAVEADLRVLPEPGLWLSLGSGIGLLAVLKRRRR